MKPSEEIPPPPDLIDPELVEMVKKGRRLLAASVVIYAINFVFMLGYLYFEVLHGKWISAGISFCCFMSGVLFTMDVVRRIEPVYRFNRDQLKDIRAVQFFMNDIYKRIKSGAFDHLVPGQAVGIDVPNSNVEIGFMNMAGMKCCEKCDLPEELCVCDNPNAVILNVDLTKAK